MLLSYETSSISYDTVDLIHGKFVPAAAPYTKEGDIRFFINIYGVFGDLTGAFAKRYDDHVMPCITDCVLNPTYIMNNISRSGMRAVMEEDYFWLYLQSYPWYMLLMQELYNQCAGKYYLLVPHYETSQMDDRITWVWRHFGKVSKDRTLLINSKSANELLIKSRNDILIGCDLLDIESWTRSGGSGFWWPEIDGKCESPAKLLSKRIKTIGQVVVSLRELNK